MLVPNKICFRKAWQEEGLNAKVWVSAKIRSKGPTVFKQGDPALKG